MPLLEDGSWRERLTARPLVRLRLSPDADPIYGAFFGTATVVRGMEFVRRHIHPMNLPNWLTHAVAIVSLVFAGIFYSRGRNSPMRSEFASLGIDDSFRDEGRYSLIIATTLNRLLLGLRPFPASHSRAGLKVTTVRYSVGAIVKGFYSVFTRKIDREVPDGVVAREARRMTLHLDCPITLDGEFFWPKPGEPVEISVTRDVTFLRCGAE
jgi:hypothetical protein